MPKFIQPVSMSVTLNDFKKDLEYPLAILGYYPVGFRKDFYGKTNNLLITNFNEDNDFTNVITELKSANRYKIDCYNPDLFLALAAMTIGRDWIVGEYLVYMRDDSVFKVEKLSGNNFERGLASNNSKHLYRKATFDEILNHFDVTTEKVGQALHKEIIGYKLIKHQYEKAAATIGAGNFNSGLSRFDEEGCGYYKLGYLGVENWCQTIENLDKAGVLKLWFEPVYKKKFKANDFIKSYNDVYKIVKVDNNKLFYRDGECAWLDANNVTIATKEEIENLLVTYFYINENEWIKVKNNKVFHDSEEITDFVLSLGKCYNEIPAKFGNYKAILNIDSVVFQETGCVKRTHLSRWLAIYKFITQVK